MALFESYERRIGQITPLSVSAIAGQLKHIESFRLDRIVRLPSPPHRNRPHHCSCAAW